MNQKIVINNAISAYFWLAILLLIPSKKENINNAFVKQHSKTALFLHFLFLINYIIFVKYQFLWTFSLIWIQVNNIFASIIFIWIFIWILYWIFKASKWFDYKINEIMSFTKTDNLIEFKQSKLSEQWILTLILSIMPFVWFILRWKFYNYNSPIINNNLKINLIISIFINLLFLNWYENIWLIFMLIYSILAVFYSILIISNQNLVFINLKKIPTIEELHIYFLSIIRYIKNYFLWQKFVWIKEISSQIETNLENEKTQNKDFLNSLKDWKIAEKIYFIPFINIFWIIDFYSKRKFQIINWIILTILSFLIFILWLNKYYQVFVLFMFFFLFWFKNKIEYKIPFLFDIYELFLNIYQKTIFTWKKIKQKQDEINEISVKI